MPVLELSGDCESQCVPRMMLPDPQQNACRGRSCDVHLEPLLMVLLVLLILGQVLFAGINHLQVTACLDGS